MMATSEPLARSSPGRRAWYFLLLALACLCWAGQGTAVKFLDRQLGPIAITFLPFYVATLALLPVLVARYRNNPLAQRPTMSDWRKFITAGVAGQILAQLGMTWGISRSLASNGAILNLLIPVFSAVLASFLLREKITRLRILTLVLGLVGVLFMSMEDLRQSSLGEMRFLVGNLMILGGCLGSSFYNVYCKGLMSRYHELDILIFSYITASVASVPLLIWAEPFHWSAVSAFDAKSWLAFAFLALLVYGASMLLFFHALNHLDVTVASTSLYLVPVFGIAIAAVLLGERLSPTALLGAGIVLSTTLLIMRYDKSW